MNTTIQKENLDEPVDEIDVSEITHYGHSSKVFSIHKAIDYRNKIPTYEQWFEVFEKAPGESLSEKLKSLNINSASKIMGYSSNPTLDYVAFWTSSHKGMYVDYIYMYQDEVMGKANCVRLTIDIISNKIKLPIRFLKTLFVDNLKK